MSDERTRLARILRDVSESGYTVALESDRWFVRAVEGVQSSVNRSLDGLNAVGRTVLHECRKRGPAWVRPKTTREKIQILLWREAQRSNIDTSTPAFAAFADQMSVLLELVVTGHMPAEQIAFEASDPVPQEEAS